MTTPVMKLCSLIEDIKTNITDAQYMEMLEELRNIHNEYTLERTDIRLCTPRKVARLAYSIIRSGVTNPGHLSYILRSKGYSHDNYLYDSFGEWMASIGIQITHNTASIM